MVTAGKDMAPVSSTSDPSKIENLPAIQILNRRGEYSATMGCVPPALRPLAKQLPWFKMGLESVRKLAGIAIAAVSARLELEESGMGAEANKDDLLSKLMKGKDENGEPMGREELTAEALTQLIAGEYRQGSGRKGHRRLTRRRFASNRLGHDLQLVLCHLVLPH